MSRSLRKVGGESRSKRSRLGLSLLLLTKLFTDLAWDERYPNTGFSEYGNWVFLDLPVVSA